MSVANWLNNLLNKPIAQSSQQARLQEPYYRFQSLAELRRAAALGVRLDVNRATVDDWLRLPGLSIHQARTLATLSQAGVQFHSLVDIAAALSLPVERLRPLEPVLQFCYYDPEALDAIQPIDLNTASFEVLEQLPGMTAALAKSIIQERQRGSYRSFSDLQQRLRLSGQVISQLMHYLKL
jgi:DNA uptake protein ComE-like DNA-binding protein